MPIAWNLPDESQVETFATLSATILGASEGVYTGLGKQPPVRILMESESGLFVASSIGTKALIATVSSSSDVDAITSALQEATNNIQEVLAHEQSEY